MVDTGLSTGQTGEGLSLDCRADQRADPRVTLLIRNAKITFPDGEFLCVIRDVSAAGMRIKIFHPLPDQTPLHVELATGECHQVTIVWARDGDVGLQFTEAQDVARLIHEQGPYAKRALRVDLDLPAAVRTVGQSSEATIRNISQFGARLECPTLFAMEQRVTLTAPSLPEISAKVRWRRDGQYGVSFQQVFGVAELAVIVATIQQARNQPPVGRAQSFRIGQS